MPLSNIGGVLLTLMCIFCPVFRVKDGKLLINTAYPGEDVEVFNSVDQTWSIASFNMPVSHPLKLRTRYENPFSLFCIVLFLKN